MRGQKLQTTSQGSGIVTHLPGPDAINKCSEFTQSVDYFLERLVKTLGSQKVLDKTSELVDKIEELAKVVHQLEALRGKPYEGDPACFRTPFLNLQINLAAKAKEQLSDEIADPVKLDFALSDEAQFLRLYSANGKPLDSELLNCCDKLFNAWLAENGMLSKQGQIYEITDDGEIKQDKNGEPITADPGQVRALLKEQNAESFEAFLNRMKIKLTTEEHSYPAQQPTAKPTAQAQKQPAPQVSHEEPTAQPDQEPGGVTPNNETGASM